MQLKVMEQVIEFFKLTDVTEQIQGLNWKLPVSEYFATLPGEAGAAVG